MWGCTGNPFHALFYASKWREASRCKTLMKKLQSTIRIQRRRRECMVRQSHADIAELLRGGRLPEALHRAEQVFKDERRLSAYDQIEMFCSCILQNYSHFQQQSDVSLLPVEVKHAIAGLIFSASRIGELLELQSVRSLLEQRFGFEFVRDNIELHPGNVVGYEIQRCLEATTTIPSDVNPQSLMGIAQKHHVNASEAPPSSVVISSSSRADVDADHLKKTKTIKKLKRIALRMVEKKKTMMVIPKKENSQHVHPNLPDCDDFEAKLQGLRKEQQQRDQSEFLR